MKKPGKFIRPIPLKHPVILHESYALKSEPFRTIGLDKLKERAELVRNSPTFIENLKRAVKENAEEKKLKFSSKEDESTANDPHNQLYSGGFLDKNSPDYDIIQKFHTLDWDKRYEQVMKIKDPRFKYFGERLIYQNEPEALPSEAYQRIHKEIAERVLRLEEKNFTTIPMAEHLIENDQKNEAKYKANLKKAHNDLDKLTKKVKSELNKDFKSIVFHDAYQYFEKRFGINILGAFTVNTDVMPGAEQLAEIREVIEHDKVSCIFSEPQFNPDIIKAVAKDTNVATGVIDPLGATLNPGKDLYFDLISNMSKSFKGC